MIEVLTLSALLFQAAAEQPRLSQPSFEGEWIVEVINNIRVMTESRVTLTIQGLSVTGSASCNTFRGTLAVGDTEVRVRQLVKTMKACDAARMSEETDFFAILQSATKFDQPSPDRLVLTTSQGKTMTARRKPADSSGH